jgi:hypothetical protein
MLVLGAILAVGAVLRAEPVISEFMASNTATITDEDGAFSDWIEIYNPDPTAVNLGGWYLTDNAANLQKWQFPAVTLNPGAYLLIFASNKDRRDPSGRLHTNFALSTGGEYLGLIHADGMTPAFEYAPEFPAQTPDVSYGVPVTESNVAAASYFSAPTPGTSNPRAAAGSALLTDAVSLSRTAGPFRTQFSLTLSGAGANQQIRYTIVTGSNPVPSLTTWTVYNGPISVTTTSTIQAAVFLADGSNHGPVTEARYTHISSALNPFSSQLPVLVIDTLGSGALVKDDIDHPSWLYAYSARTTGGTFGSSPEVISPLETTVRGSTSAEFPKKGYNIKFTDSEGEKRSQSLVDLPAYEKWALVAPWMYDPSFVNNAFTYGLSNKMGRWAPQTRFAEVFMNTGGDDVDMADYAGIYLITDRVEVAKGRVDITPLLSSDVSGTPLTGGYILKIDAKDTNEIGWVTSHGIPENGTSSVVLVSPKAEDIAPAQLNYIRDYVQRMENALYNDRDSGWATRTYLDYIDRGSWVDHHILNTFVCNPDAFQRSAYFTKDRNGKLKAGPVWDFDRALGSYQDERSFRYDVWMGLGGPDVWATGWWGTIAHDPEFMQDWVDRWQALRQNELSYGSLTASVDALGASVGAAAAGRDAARWPDNASPYGSYAAQIEHLKGWVTLRAEWIDSQFVAAPTVKESAGALVFTAPEGAELAYTLDGSDPRSLGGAVAPNAILTKSALTTPAAANVHVRSYRADRRDVFPGSPWSSAVGGEKSTPLTPKARLVNISSRAMVGVGENALIAGVVVADTESKRYLARGIGPALAQFGASGLVPDPQLSIYGSTGLELFRNSGWESGADALQIPTYSRSVGAFPLATGSRDSALANNLTAGAYTVQITTPTAQNGIGLAELYELDDNGRTVNLSTRAQVRTGDGVLIGGFVVSGPAYKRMLIRAVGPTLGAFGVSTALKDPVLTVYSGQTVVATNDRWESDAAAQVAAATKSVGAFALASSSEDAALLITLAPGAYTVDVRGKANTQGVALLEIYEVP